MTVELEGASGGDDRICRHLETMQPEARALLTASVDERIYHIFRDKFILHPDVAEILSTLKDALVRPPCERPIGFALIGGSGEGKTALINRFGRDLGGDPLRQPGVHDKIRLLIAKMPPRATDPRIMLMLARALRQPIVYGGRSREISDMILRQLRQKEVRMIIFQEFNNVAPIPAAERKVVYDFIQDLNADGIVIVVVGTEETLDLIREEEELVTRLKPLRVRGFSPDVKFGSFLATIETFYPLPEPSDLARCHNEIHRRTNGVVGEVVSLVNEAAAWAVRNNRPCIDREALKNCRYIPAEAPASGSKP